MDVIHQQFNRSNAIYRLVDGLAIILGLTLTLLRNPDLNSKATLVVCLATIGIYSLIAEFMGMYRNWVGSRIAGELGCSVLTWATTLLALIALGQFSEYTTELSENALISWFLITPLFVVFFRLLYRLHKRFTTRLGISQKNYAILGVDDIGFQIAKNIEANPEMNLNLVGFYDDRPEERLPKFPADIPRRLGDIDDLIEKARSGSVEHVYISLPMRAETRINDILQKLGDTTASVYIVPNFFVFRLLHSRWSDVNGLPVVSLIESPIYGVDGITKRIADIVLASIGLLFACLPMLLIALLIKLTSRGPVFFRQKRYGLDGREILVWKFRSMTVTENGEKVTQATRNDSRVTVVGRFIRKTSLDELPQFFNVLMGSMSMVGPRPHATAHNEEYRGLIDGYMLRHKIKPGITGLAQVNGCRGETDTIEKMEKRVEYDHRYIREWSFWLDIQILFKTFSTLLGDKNAY